MAIGTVKIFGVGGLYGFIIDDSGNEHFFHINQAQQEVEFTAGDRVEFLIEQNPTRPGMTRARDVKLVI
jgi:cold shock CspA family protein